MTDAPRAGSGPPAAALVVAGGNCLLLVATSFAASPAAVVAAESILSLAVLRPLLRTTTPLRAFLGYGAVATVATAGVALGLSITDRLWVLAGCLVGLVAVLSYALHRYELVRLGLAGAESEPETRPTGGRDG